ncbi:DUF1206 domain-containing protein [Pseudarthrobacter sp. J1738]|uniref:DUF1206 domain-containing protein n=1 Tax=Pseudarthrobacter sp. J1738 TaxID=3420446 RepID=UPI003D2A56B3
MGNAVSRAASSADDAVDDIKDSKVVRVLARSGYAAIGLVHVLIGVTALRLALGEKGDADQSGAVSQLASNPFSLALLWAGFIVCAVLALYLASEALMGWRFGASKHQVKNRLKAGGQAVVLAAAAIAFGGFALGQSSDSGQSSKKLSADLMSSTPGTVLLAAIGAGLMVAGVVFVVIGVRRGFEKHLRGQPSGTTGTAFIWLGVAGYCAKGVALAAVGLLIVVATVKHDPSKSGGLDEALKAFLAQSFGVWIVALIGIGLIAYGLFSVLRSRYQRL